MTRSKLSILSIHSILLLTTLFTLWPEMVVYPYLVNNGFKLYIDIINPYPPYLTFALAALTRIFGYNPINFKLLTIAVVLTIDLLIFFLSKRIFKNPKIPLINTLFFVVFSVPFGINGLWFDLFQTPLILLSVYFLLFSKSRKHILISSILLTIAILIKQQAIWLIPLFLIFSKKNIKTLTNFFSPMLAAALFTGLLVIATADLKSFIEWAIVLPMFKASSMPGYVLVPSLRQAVTAASPFLFFTPFLINVDNKTRKVIYIAIFLMVFAYPRFDYFHLIPSLAVLSLAAGKVLTTIKLKPLSIAPIVLLTPLLVYQFHFYSNNIKQQTRFFENDIMESAQKLKEASLSSDRFYVQNGPDQVLALSGRLPIKPWADEFPWYLENNDLQNKILVTLYSQQPKYIISKPYSQGPEFGLGSYRPKQIADYLDLNYQIKLELPGQLQLKEKIKGQ